MSLEWTLKILKQPQLYFPGVYKKGFSEAVLRAIKIWILVITDIEMSTIWLLLCRMFNSIYTLYYLSIAKIFRGRDILVQNRLTFLPPQQQFECFNLKRVFLVVFCFTKITSWFWHSRFDLYHCLLVQILNANKVLRWLLFNTSSSCYPFDAWWNEDREASHKNPDPILRPAWINLFGKVITIRTRLTCSFWGWKSTEKIVFTFLLHFDWFGEGKIGTFTQ